MLNKNDSILWKLFHRYFIVALNGMTLGLFCTLITGLIIKQIGLSFWGNLSLFLISIASVAMSLTGPMIGIGVSQALKSPKLVVLSSGVTGFIGAFGSAFADGKMVSKVGSIIVSGPGDPLGAFLSVVVGAEIGKLISGKTKVDIIITPLMTIIFGSITAFFTGPIIHYIMNSLGEFITVTTEIQPFLMGMTVSVIMGIVLTLPISSAALSIILGISGLAAGAATVGCSAQMIGFAVISYHVNGWNGLLAQGIGTSMLQIPNIIKKPIIWLPPIVASALLGPISAVFFKMKNNPVGAGMGTSGLVGQFMTWQTMSCYTPHLLLFIEIFFLHIIAPAIISISVAKILKIKGYISDSDYKIDL